MTNTKSWKALSISVTLISLVLVSAFAASGIVTVQAGPCARIWKKFMSKTP